jgi:hypothetical protein
MAEIVNLSINSRAASILLFVGSIDPFSVLLELHVLPHFETRTSNTAIYILLRQTTQYRAKVTIELEWTWL